jgi:hypothetical protein
LIRVEVDLSSDNHQQFKADFFDFNFDFSEDIFGDNSFFIDQVLSVLDIIFSRYSNHLS